MANRYGQTRPRAVRGIRYDNAPLTLSALAIAIALWAGPASGKEAAETSSELLHRGAALANQGSLDLGIGAMTRALAIAATPEERAAVQGELGAALTRAGRYAEAEIALKLAYAAGGPNRAARAIDLGNLASATHHNQAAIQYFQEAQGLAGSDSTVGCLASINMARLLPPAERLPALFDADRRLNRLANSTEVATLRVNIGHQARLLGPQGRALAELSLSKAERTAESRGIPRLQAEALAELALLEEERGEPLDAINDTRRALVLVYREPPSSVIDLKVQLEHLEGRLLAASGDKAGALLSYTLAADAIEGVREDMPIEDDDGRSTYSTTIEPVTRSLVGLLVSQADPLPHDQSQAILHRAIDFEEKMHAAEMQDFLGERCSVETGQVSADALLGADTALLYPLQFSDHLELLLRTPHGIFHQRVDASSAEVAAAVRRLSGKLRNGEGKYLADSRKLYGWLVAPLADKLAEQNIKTLVISPDSSLHMVPFAALHDGTKFLIENYAVANVTGLSMTNLDANVQRRAQSLVAGMSEAGGVVDKLASDKRLVGVTESVSREADRPAPLPVSREAIPGADGTPISPEGVPLADLDKLRADLALPGVKKELASLKTILPGRQLADADFTAKSFTDQASSGEYGIVHIASHGYFGKSADESFVLAYDDVLTMKQLQSLLTADKAHGGNIDLLTLSACDTAEGNSRAPLGIAGAGIKAGASAVVGSLWQVEDEATHRFMEDFYRGLAGGKVSKAEAMRGAQLALLKNPDTANPMYWAPFTLIGNWK